MQTHRTDQRQALSIHRLDTEFQDRSRVHLCQVCCGCCCCCCCIQAFVGAAAGLIAAPLVLRVGLLPIRLRYRWPIVLRIVILGLVLGAAQGILACSLWTTWDDHLYVGSCLAPALIGLGALAVAMIRDARRCALLQAPPFYSRPRALLRSTVLVVVLAASLGSLGVSACDKSPDGRIAFALWFALLIGPPVVGALVGWRLARADERFIPLRSEPNVATLVAALIGANLCALLTAEVWILATEIPSVVPKLITYTAQGLVGLWSLAVCFHKARTSEPAAWHAGTGVIVLSDMIVVGLPLFILEEFGSLTPMYWLAVAGAGLGPKPA